MRERRVYRPVFGKSAGKTDGRAQRFLAYAWRDDVNSARRAAVEGIGAVLVALGAFWEFIQREYRLRNACVCLRVLHRHTTQRMA